MSTPILTALCLVGVFSFAIVLLGVLRVAYEKASEETHRIIDTVGTVAALLLAVDVVVLVVLIVIGLVTR
jgi:hypothetical protein